jgi:hypothetical protein
MILVLVVVLVTVGVLAHLLYTGIALNGLRMMIHDLRSPEFRATHPRIRARNMDAAPRRAVYGMYGVWIALSVLVVALALAHWT